MATDTHIWNCLITTLLGRGILGAIVKEFFAGGKTRAEEKKTEAKAERIKAETTKILSELNMKQTSSAATKPSEDPMGWFKSGSNPGEYNVRLDQENRFHGKPSCLIESCNFPSGFCTLMQMMKADSYIGKRIK